jgi:hypothetical protein
MVAAADTRSVASMLGVPYNAIRRSDETDFLGAPNLRYGLLVRAGSFGTLAAAIAVLATGGAATVGGCGRSHVGEDAGDASGDASGDAASEEAAPRAPRAHRPSSVACPAERGEPTNMCPSGVPDPDSRCAVDGDCVSGSNGRCGRASPRLSGCLTLCSYDDCFKDEDCAANTPCGCRASASDDTKNTCLVGSTCRTDADCGEGGYCSPSLHQVSCSCVSAAFCKPDSGKCFEGTTEVPCKCGESCGHGYYCHTPKDTCLDDSDCPAGKPCGYDLPSQSWICVECLP